MYPLTEIKLDYITFRINGLSKGKAYQAASPNTSLKSCYNIGARIEKQDPRILQLICEGLKKKQQIIEQKRVQIHKEHFERVSRIRDLDEAEKGIQRQTAKLIKSPRDNSHLILPSDRLPTRAQCGGTVQGNMHRPPERKVKSKGWDVFGDRGRR